MNLLKDGILLEENYEILEGDHLVKEVKVFEKDEKTEKAQQEEKQEELNTIKNNEAFDNKNDFVLENADGIEKSEIALEDKSGIIKEEFLSITVTVNGQNITLMGKNQYIIVDIFDYIDFDLTIAKGIINLTLNGNKTSYTAKINGGDVIEVFWSNV